jgi:hypothetical protein
MASRDVSSGFPSTLPGARNHRLAWRGRRTPVPEEWSDSVAGGPENAVNLGHAAESQYSVPCSKRRAGAVGDMRETGVVVIDVGEEQ